MSDFYDHLTSILETLLQQHSCVYCGLGELCFNKTHFAVSHMKCFNYKNHHMFCLKRKKEECCQMGWKNCIKSSLPSLVPILHLHIPTLLFHHTHPAWGISFYICPSHTLQHWIYFAAHQRALVSFDVHAMSCSYPLACLVTCSLVFWSVCPCQLEVFAKGRQTEIWQASNYGYGIIQPIYNYFPCAETATKGSLIHKAASARRLENVALQHVGNWHGIYWHVDVHHFSFLHGNWKMKASLPEGTCLNCSAHKD